MAKVHQMSWPKPSSDLLFRAIEIYLKHAHSPTPPAGTLSRIDALRQTPADRLFDSDAFERDEHIPPTRYSLRLGNRFYPHMKLAIERSPDGRGHLFRVDTHDRHIRPAPGSRDAKPFEQLMKMNQQLAEAIEGDWEAQGVPTFKGYLREDLKRRGASDRMGAI